jgi:CheY-like chemotaxis protein
LVTAGKARPFRIARFPYWCRVPSDFRISERRCDVANILVIDDDPLVRETVRSMLERKGHKVTLADHGGTGLKHFGNGKNFALVITDLLMPEVEGMETVRRLRKISMDTPIIAMSGGPTTRLWVNEQAGADYLKMARVFGANHVLSKPFTTAQLLAAVDACLAESPNRRKKG